MCNSTSLLVLLSLLSLTPLPTIKLKQVKLVALLDRQLRVLQPKETNGAGSVHSKILFGKTRI